MSARGPVARAARLVAAQLRLSALAAAQYRVGFWTEGVLAVFWSLVGIVPLWVAIDHRGAVVGWGPWELMVLTGCFAALSSVFGAFLQPALIESMNHIRRGTLDHVLLRPADSLLLCLVAAFSPWRLLELVFGLVLIALSLARLGVTPELASVGVALGMGLASVACLYGLGILTLCLSFRAMQLQNLTYLFEALLDFSRWPIGVFRGLLKALFTFVIPLAVMTTYPAAALIGRADVMTLASALLTGAALLVVARLCWQVAVRGYTSASS
ncbi:MAG: ABC-2 family transporter protein [Myxococcales bacterium]|nr:ABC-2 family transporter protein [Myxococcales bacterium]